MKKRGFDTAFHAEARLCGLTLRAAKQLIKCCSRHYAAIADVES